MSQFKTTSSISPSISAPIAQGEVVGVGVKRRGGGVLDVTKGDAKQKNVSFWAMCEVNACLGKSPWHVTDQHQRQGEAPEIAKSNAFIEQPFQGHKKFRGEIISGSKMYRCFMFPTVRQRRCRYPTAPSSLINCHAITLRGPHFQIEMVSLGFLSISTRLLLINTDT